MAAPAGQNTGSSNTLVPALARSSLDNCSDNPARITCPEGQTALYVAQNSGQTALYVAQNSVDCAHYICSAVGDGGDSGSNSGSPTTKSVVLPAILGSLLPAIAIGFGIVFYISRRRKAERTTDAQHQDAKYMSSYNNLADDTFGADPRSPGAYSSTYSVSKWRDSAFPAPGSPHSHASIPIIFSQENSAEFQHGSRETKLYDGAQESAYRETRLFTASASSENHPRQWAAPNVVNVKQKPQLVVLDSSTVSTVAGAGLAVSTAGIRDLQADDSDSASDSDSDTSSPATPYTPDTPDTPDTPNVSEASAPATTQMPRIVQVGRPLMIRALESSQKQEQLSPNSPLRVENNGWDSESDAESDVGSDVDDEVDDEVESGVEDEVESDVESDVGGQAESDVGNDVESEVESDVESDMESDAEYDVQSEARSDSESEYEYDAAEDSNPNLDHRPDAAYHGDSSYSANEPSPARQSVPSSQRLTLGTTIAFESIDDSFSAEVFKATANLDTGADSSPKP
ncbi:hypothetical protein GGI02_004234 [Coemansia sp. RSA 2322]|nr:hypothetical protein GGI02_004234 [Coemansia sp. RSA 2322]